MREPDVHRGLIEREGVMDVLGRTLASALLGAVLVFSLGCPSEVIEQAEEASAEAQTFPGLTCPTPNPQNCPSPIYNQALVQPAIVRPGADGVLKTHFVVDEHTYDCIPVWDGSEWEYCQMELRTYFTPSDPRDPDSALAPSIPGPTLRPRAATLADPLKPYDPKTNPIRQNGSTIELLLENQLPNNSTPAHDCDPATYMGCETSKQNCSWGNGQWTCKSDPSQQCVEVPVTQECFHGADVTNLHYHGTHVSPQPPQDFVLLSVYSSEQTDPPPPAPSDTVAVGSYQFEINPLPWNQAPGTHWYHPHKHGSTALQVLNGMAGALTIEGAFDDWLYGFYDVDPKDEKELESFEKLLVLQQVWTGLNFFFTPPPSTYPPQLLVNGQANPKITMRPREVQRWRFVNGTMQAASQVTVDFPDGYTVVQIAQDGVQFAPENYERQPLMEGGTISISPGNRVDFLVQAPAQEQAPAHASFRVFGNLADDVRERIEGLRALHATNANALFTVETAGDADPMTLPTTAQWPKTPYYLRDIADSELVNKDDPRTLAFSMTDPDGTVTKPGSQPDAFWINEQQYDGSCAAETMRLRTAERWLLTNDSHPQHPFHIHINPFQIVRNDTTEFEPPWIWWDTIGLPADDSSQCRSTGQCETLSVDIRHRFEDYGGIYVIHCHFLGHEDRGMMVNVQTRCQDADYFGTPQSSGLADDCATPSSLLTPNPFPGCGY
jgi:FtsP/CotA-like multicopper oxidase with cupredoxin domain